jgi:predicted Fe-Mo cluster-binding NifX family protein
MKGVVMRVAIVLENDKISQHFGKSNCIGIYEVNQSVSLMHKIEGFTHEHGGIPTRILEEKVDVVICGNLGAQAKQKMMNQGIKVISGVSGNVDEVLLKFKNDELISSIDTCQDGNHEHHHE